jgi:DNA topoisomerase VI subunit B
MTNVANSLPKCKVQPVPGAAKPAQLQRATFRTSRLLDFFSEKELVAQTGHHAGDWPLVAVKELIDNALDACEEAGIAPVITIAADKDGIEVRDNGPGLPAETVKGILDYTVRVSSREAYVSPTRGAQGNALKTLIGMPFALDPSIGRVLEIEAKHVRHTIGCSVDRIRQEPVLDHRTKTVLGTTGTLIRVHWPNSACSNLLDVKARFLQIADDFTWLNPHLTLVVDWFGEQTRVIATDPAWQKWRPSDPTCPHWYGIQHFERLIAAYIAHDQDNGRERTVREFISEFRGLSGSAKQKVVLDATGLSRESLSRLANGNGLETVLTSRLLAAMQANSRPMKPKDLGIIGEEHFRRRFEAAGCETESFQYQRAFDDEGQPAVIETAFGWCPKVDSRRLVTGVNWSPGIINPFRELGGCGRSLDTILAQQRAARDEPVIFVLHLAVPRAQYTDRGKSAVTVDE